MIRLLLSLSPSKKLRLIALLTLVGLVTGVLSGNTVRNSEELEKDEIEQIHQVSEESADLKRKPLFAYQLQWFDYSLARHDNLCRGRAYEPKNLVGIPIFFCSLKLEPDPYVQ